MYSNNYYQPNTMYSNPYESRLNALQQMQTSPPVPTQQITRVNGRNGVDAYQMSPNSSVLLLDETGPIVWVKQTDGAGYATATPYSITPYQPEQPVDTKSLEERISRLEELMNEQSNIKSNSKSKAAGGTKQSSGNDTAV